MSHDIIVKQHGGTRVLRGENPSALPAQAPTKNQLVLNLQTARRLNFGFPQTLLAVADEVIE